MNKYTKHSGYNKDLKGISQTLRKNMTKEEKHLWYDFLRKHKYSFQRQRPVADYVVDFYCPKLKLAIELDGSQHYSDEGLVKDKKRDAVLEKLGIFTLRIKNYDINTNFVNACKSIDEMIECLEYSSE